jgi:hypothetical protein
LCWIEFGEVNYLEPNIFSEPNIKMTLTFKVKTYILRNLFNVLVTIKVMR